MSANPCTTWNTPAGKSGLQKNLFQLHGREGRELRGFEDHGVAAGQGWRGFPAGDLQRVVPGADAGDHAQGFAARVAEGLRAEIDVLAAQGLREAGEILQAIRAGQHVHDQGFLDGLAGIARFELGEFSIARAQDRAPRGAGCAARSAPRIAAQDA